METPSDTRTLEEIWKTAEEIGTEEQSQANDEEENYSKGTKEISLEEKGKSLKARECKINKSRQIRAIRENEIRQEAELEVKDKIKTTMRVAREVTAESQRRLKEGFEHMKEVSDIGRQEVAKSKETRRLAIQNLKDNINKSRGTLAKNSESIREEKKLLEKLQKEEFDKILSEGRNPYEVYRKREIEKGHENDVAQIKENIERQEAQLAVRIFKEEEVEFQIQKKEEQHRAAVQRFQKDMGILSKQAKVQDYLQSHTMAKTSVLNPTGANKPIYPSEFSTAKTRAFGTGKAKSGNFLVEKLSEKYPNAMPIPELLPRGKELQGDTASKRTTKPSSDFDNDDLVYAVPEFQATWKATEKQSVSKGDNTLQKKMKLTVFEQKSLQRAKEKHKANMIQSQVVGGREFVGNTFSASPMVLLFKDFEVGKTHMVKVTLTNVSLGRATFKVLEIPLEFRTLFDIDYKLPGFISPGMTSEITVKFTPQADKDLDTCLPLMSDSGPISIPVVCRTKKAILELSSKTVEFGAVTLGEGFHQNITVKNHGCLDVALDVQFSSEEHNGDKVLDSNNGQLDKESGFSVLRHDDGFTVGPASKFLKGFDSMKIPLHFQATREGDFSSDLILSARAVNAPTHEIPSECIHLFATGNPLPVSVKQKTLNFGCCVFDEHYRDKLVVKNSGKVAMKLRLVKRQIASEFFHFSPDIGFCQPGEECIFSIDFCPKETILKNLSRFRSGEDDCSMEIPMKVQVTNQALPLEFVLKFSVTTGDLLFDPPAIDFGDCILNEQAAATLTIRNTSALPHQFGFPSLPKGVRMSNRFGTILPSDSFAIEVFYQPSTPHKRSFNLRCHTLLDRTFTIPCTARGLGTDLVFSHNHIRLPSTAVGDVSTSTTVLRNVGLGTQKWQLAVPEGSNLVLSPAAGMLTADECVRIQVNHSPVAVHEEPSENETSVDANTERTGVDQDSPEEGKMEPKREEDEETKSSDVVPDLFPHVQTWKIPCMYSNKGNEIQAIQLQISTCIVDEELKLEGGDVSTLSKSNYLTDFGSVSVGDHATHTVVVKNVGDCDTELKMEPLDPHGPFRMVNALRTIATGQSFNLGVQFWPTTSEPCHEILVVGTKSSKARLKLKGQGFLPEIKITPEDILEDGLDMGHLSPLCQSEQCIQLFNTREYPVMFSVGPKASRKTAEDGSRLVFACRPSEGTLNPDESREVKVIFSPLHQGPAYVDEIEIKPTGQKLGVIIPVKGYCWSSGAFIVGPDDPRKGKIDQEVTEDGLHYKLDLEKTVRCGETAVGVIRVGSLKNEKEKTGSPAELVLSSPDPQLLRQGWTIDTLKIQAAAGDLKPVSIKFTAPDTAFDYTISRLDCPHIVSLNLEGVLKGGTPPLPSAEGVRIKITVSTTFDPRSTEKEDTV